MHPSPESLKTIRFENEMLPNWAQLLDLAARICPVSEETRRWFSRFTNSSGTDDARTITLQSEILLTAIRQHKESLVSQLQTKREGPQASQIIAAWEYALDTMMLAARANKTCSWQIEGAPETNDGDLGGGDITLRRV